MTEWLRDKTCPLGFGAACRYNDELVQRARIYFVWMFPLLGLGSAFLLRKGLKTGREAAPLLAGIGLFLSGYFGLVASMYPYAIPPTVTLYEAAAQEETLRFTLWGTAIVLSLVIIYSYSVFRGKVGQEGYYGSGG